jgi:hypothetical protein
LTLQRCVVGFGDMTTTSNKWYLRLYGEVKGPYPAGLISRYLLLGRVTEGDEVSNDGEQWLPIRDVPELIPQVMKGDASDPLYQERLEASRRWADERRLDRRGGSGDVSEPQDNRRSRDRRAPEQSLVVEHRHRRHGRQQDLFDASQGRWAILMIVGTVAVLAGSFLLLYKPPPPQLGSNCHSPAAANVNWSNCVLDGTNLQDSDLAGARLFSASLTATNLSHSDLKGGNLSYAALSIADLQMADLRGATLVGAKLRQAKLNNARLEDADLSYADLTGADLSGAQIHNTKLGNAIWVDGRRCLPGSIDHCQPAQ